MRRLLLRAPLAAFGSPVTVLVAVLAGVVVAFVAAGTVFHVSASGSAGTQLVTDTRCVEDTGLTLTPTYDLLVDNGEPMDRGDDALPAIREAAAARGMGMVQRTRVLSAPLFIGSERIVVNLVERGGGVEWFGIAGAGDGFWLSSTLVTDLPDPVTPGTTTAAVEFGGEGVRHEFPVAAVFPSLTDPLDPFWCVDRQQVVPNPLSDGARPTVLVPTTVMDRLLATAGAPPNSGATIRITGPAVRTATSARERADAVVALRADVVRIAGPNAFRTQDRAAFLATVGPRTHAAVSQSLLPLSGVSLLVGLGAVAGLARQWMLRRHPELRLLWTRGVPPSALGLKAVLELALPLALGAALGWVAARLVVPVLAPAAQLDPWATGLAWLAAAGSWAGGVAVLGVASTIGVRRRFQVRPLRGAGRVRRVLRRFPWELVVLGAAVLSWQRLRDGAVTVDAGSLLPVVDVIALLFPLLCIAVLLGVVLRLSGLALRLGHRVRGWRLPSVLWAARRLAAQQRLVVALVAVAGFAVGVVAVGVGVSGTEQAAVLDKGRVFVGSDTSVRLAVTDGPSTVPQPVAGESTLVWLREVGLPDNRRGRVLAVDPATFERGVRWRSQWTGYDLAPLLDRLGPVGADGRIPALRVGADDPPAFDAGLPPVDVVATLPTFPGRGHDDGMLVMSTEALGDRSGYSRYVWSRTDAAAVVAALTAAGEPTAAALTAAGATDGLPFLVVAWTFDFFVLLGAVLAVVAVAALLVTVEARRRAAAVANALLARMGVRARSLYGSQVVELTAITVTACAVGLLAGVAVLVLAAGHLDPRPGLSPAPVAVSLLPLASVVAVVAAVAVLLVAAVAVRAAVRAPVKELLRG